MTQSFNPPPLYTQNPLERFSDRAQDYARYRPSYRPEAIDRILADLPPVEQLAIADIGAGTGISSRLFADRGARVWAIEPNAAMRQAAVPHPLVSFQGGTAEQTQLADQSVDLVVCCQSFHWFDKPIALAEFHRILKPGGRVGLMWNDRNLDDPFTREYSEIVQHAADRQIFNRDDRKSGDTLQANPLFTNFRVLLLFHEYPLNLESLIGLVLSASYIPKAGTAYEQLITDLQALYHHWSDAATDTVSLSYQVKLYLADRVNAQ